jgi:hypothetical protein
MNVRDYFMQGRRGWVRLHEKGGKEYEVPCRHSLEQCLEEYIAAAGIAGESDAPLFQAAADQPEVGMSSLADCAVRLTSSTPPASW